MKIGIIGAGNIGGAIAKGLVGSKAIDVKDLYLSDPNSSMLAEFADMGIQTSNSNSEVAKASELLIVAVKPWLAQEVIHKLRSSIQPQAMLASVVAGLTLDTLVNEISPAIPVFRVIPNTAIAVGQSMTFISSINSTKEQDNLLVSLFANMGKAMLIPDQQMAAATSLASCGIAYAMRYISASMRAGVEVGFPADTAKEIVLQTLNGAVDLLRSTQQHPETEIDKVTTPKGVTIKGLNELEHSGFSSAIINAIKASTAK